ncbi:MAG: PQQ-dependent sugar dehydrogenase, partial [Microbacteriaceae bacterium]
MPQRRAQTLISVAAAALLVLSGCTLSDPEQPDREPNTEVPTQDGNEQVLATKLEAPWSFIELSSGSILITERDSRKLLELGNDGSMHTIATIDEVVPAGEGGLLGIAVNPMDETELFLYFTAHNDNRVVKYRLDGSSGNFSLFNPEVIVSDIPKAGNHNGGRIAFGPDQKLYI